MSDPFNHNDDVKTITINDEVLQFEIGIKNPNFEGDTESGKNDNDKTFNKTLSNSDEPQNLNENYNVNRCDQIVVRDLVSYYLLGLCNNFGFFVMLSAANDIMDEFDNQDKKAFYDVKTGRTCHMLSTGTILLADVIPGLIVKCILPFVPFNVNVQVSLSILMATLGYFLVGFSMTEFYTILGIVLISASACLGESTFLSYSTNYNKHVVAAWSAGGAGIAGSLSYAALRSLNVPERTILTFMLIIPMIKGIVFWLLLHTPQNKIHHNENSIKDKKPLETVLDKFIYLGYLLKYMIPLMVIYFAQYFINQGLFQLVYFENSFLDKASQYRWFIVDYQIGVFIARATVSLFSIKKIWIMSILQLLNVVYFLNEAIFYITPIIWITFIVVFWEGLLGGGGYAYTFYKISQEITNDRKRIAMAIVSTSDTIGITIAGFAAISVHNAICSLAAPVRH